MFCMSSSLFSWYERYNEDAEFGGVDKRQELKNKILFKFDRFGALVEISASPSSSFWSTSFGWVFAGCTTISLVVYISQRGNLSVVEPTHENTVI